MEDFVDEDTGEVVSIERNDVIIDRESVLDSDNIEAILDSGTQNILLHREDQNLSDYAIIYNTLQKDPSNSEKEAVLYIYRQLRNAEPLMRLAHARLSRTCSSQRNVMIWVRWDVTGSTRS